MIPDTALTIDSRRQFKAQGFLVVPQLCPQQMVSEMHAAANRDLASALPPVELEAEVGYPGAPAGPEAPGGRTIRRLKDALGRDPLFGRWATDPELLYRVRHLLGDDDIRLVRAHHNCIMTKHPRFSSATGWHQDIRYWSFATCELVNAWTALGVELKNNGGMRLIPGSHRIDLPAERFDPARFLRPDHPDNRALIDAAIQVDLGPGDVLFFHAGLLHSAGCNQTGERKLSVVFSYRAAANKPVPGTRSAEREDIDPGRAAG